MEETLGKRISQNRKRLGLTQDQLAEKLGVTAQAVSKWENDLSCPDITMLSPLAEIFGVTTDELLGVAAVSEPLRAQIVDEEENGLHAQIGNCNIHVGSGRKAAVGFALFVLLTGLLTLISGVLQLGTTFWSILWPTALLVFGLFGLYPRFSFLRLGCSMLGLYFLLQNINLLPFSIGGEIMLPAMVIILGLALLADAIKKPRKPSFQFECGDNKFTQTISTAEGYLDYSASFGEATQVVSISTLKGGQIHTNFGDYTVSLAEVNAVERNCSLELHCNFGELNLLVPRRFAVRPTSRTSFAALDIEGEPDAVPEAYIDADVHISFGAINIQYI